MAGALSGLIITTMPALSKLIRAAFPFCTIRTRRGSKRASPFRCGGRFFDASGRAWFYPPPVLYGNPVYPIVPGRRFPKRVHPPQPIYRPVTAVFVRQGGRSGIVPRHPLDQKGKTPLNLERGVFSNVGMKGSSEQVTPVERWQKWHALKSPPRDALSGSLLP